VDLLVPQVCAGVLKGVILLLLKLLNSLACLISIVICVYD